MNKQTQKKSVRNKKQVSSSEPWTSQSPGSRVAGSKPSLKSTACERWEQKKSRKRRRRRTDFSRVLFPLSRRSTLPGRPPRRTPRRAPGRNVRFLGRHRNRRDAGVRRRAAGRRRPGHLTAAMLRTVRRRGGVEQGVWPRVLLLLVHDVVHHLPRKKKGKSLFATDLPHTIDYRCDDEKKKTLKLGWHLGTIA